MVGCIASVVRPSTGIGTVNNFNSLNSLPDSSIYLRKRHRVLALCLFYFYPMLKGDLCHGIN